MRFKREIIAIILIICVLFTISAIGAADSSQEAIGIADGNEQVTEISLDSHKNLATENDGEILGEGESSEVGTFAELNGNITKADENSVLYLNNNYKFTDSVDSNGVTISKSLTIDGQGHTIDANEKTRIFYFYQTASSKSLTLKNIKFVNGKHTVAGAVYGYCGGNLVIENCTFINNTATSNAAGALYFSPAGSDGTSKLVDCTFINNKAASSKQGGAVYFNPRFSATATISNCNFINNSASDNLGTVFIAAKSGYDVNVDKCIFVGNKGLPSAIYVGAGNPIIGNSVFVNNEGTSISSGSYYSTITIGANWWGNTADNYDTDLSNVEDATVSKWLFLNMSTNDGNDIATVSLNNLYDNGAVSVYNDYALPTIKLNVKKECMSVSEDNLVLDQTGEATLGYTLIPGLDASLTVSYDAVEITKEFYETDSGAMADLNNKIQTAISHDITEIKLHNDYAYDDNEAIITNTITGSSNSGIGIATDLTIDGQGFTIDGKNRTGRIFYFRDSTKTKSLTLKNINFVNCKDGYGGAIYVTCKDLTIDNCTFTGCTATGNPGGAIYSNVYGNYLIKNTNFTSNMVTANNKGAGAIAIYTNSGTTGEIVGCNFTNNKITGSGGYSNSYGGGAIFISSNQGVGGDSGIIRSCFFKGNAVSGNIGNSIFFMTPGTYSISNSIMLDTGNVINGNNYERNIDYNWWGSTVDDYSNLDVDAKYNYGQNANPINKWLYLDVAVDNSNGIATISLNNLNDETKYQDYELPKITLNVEATNANLDSDTVTLDENGQATVNYQMTGKIGALKVSCGDVELTKEIKMPIEGTFTSLVNDLDEIGEEGTIELNQDYHYNSTVDDLLTNGIEITKSVTIDGHGFTIDGMGLSNIFYLNDGSKTLTLKNIIFANATAANGAAVYFNGKKIEIDNCTFINNTATSQGDAIYIANAESDANKITGTAFINNTGENSVAFINLDSTDAKLELSNSIFMDNGAVNNIKGTGNVIVEHNWWGNTIENYNQDISKVDGATVNSWLFLKIDADAALSGTATVSLNNAYDGSQVTDYITDSLPKITLDLDGVDTSTQVSSVLLGSNGQATYKFKMNKVDGTLTARYGDIPTSKQLNYVCVDDGSFKALNEIIWFSSENDEIQLTHDYVYSDSDTITTGIQITKTITIDGNGNTIDAKGNCGIFLINSPNVAFKNIIFKNGIFATGGAIYASQNADYLNVENCTFINNTATNTDGGAIWSGAYDFGSVVGSTFINNTADKDGAAIFTYSYYSRAVVDKCTFINNSASDSVIYAYYMFYPHDSIFINNTGTNLFGGYSSGHNISNNWYGNTFDNYDSKIVSGSISKWLYLNIKFFENYAIVSLNNIFTSSSSSSSVYSNFNLPEITLNINSTTLNLETDKVTLDDNGKAIVPYTVDGETGALTVSWNGITLTKDRVLPEFDSIQTLIDNADENSVIELDCDYTYNDADEITEGIIINKNITIDGKGHTIDVKQMTRIFNVQALNVTFKNIVFANGKGNLVYDNGGNPGGAIYLNLDNTEDIEFNVDNCTFVNNTANKDNYDIKYQGGAIYIKANGGTYNIKNSAFINNNALGDNSGAIYLNVKDAEFDLYNSSFIGNKAVYNGALYLETDNTETTIDKCLFRENVISSSSYSSIGTAIIWKSTNDNGNNVVKNSIFIDNNGNAVKNNNYVFLLKSGTVNIDGNWWGTTTSNNIALGSYYIQGITPNSWLFLNASVSSSKLLYNETSTISYYLQSYDGSEVSEFDNTKLPGVTFDVTSDNGGLDKDVVSLNEEFTYRATYPGSACIDIYCNNLVYETWIKGPYMVPIVDIPFTIYANQGLAKNAFIKTANGYYSGVTVTCNDSELINLEGNYDVTARTTEGTVKLTFTYAGSTYYDAEVFEMDVNVVRVPLTINVTNIESNEITLNISDEMDLDISFEIDQIHKGYAPAWNVWGFTYDSSVITFTYDGGDRPDNGSSYPTGHIKAKAGGTTNLTIYCTSDKFKWENYTIEITVNKIPTEITASDINPLKVDDEGGVNAIFFINGTQSTTNLVYESSDENIVKFINNNEFKAIGNGTAVLTVRFNGNSTHENSSKSITVTVTKYDVGINLDHSNSLELNVDDTSKINATLSDVEATGALNYTSSNSSVVTVDNETGEIVAVGNGTAIVTVYYPGDRKYAETSKTVTITVNRIETELTLTASNVTPKYDETITLTAAVKAMGEEITEGTVTYFIGDNQINSEFTVDRVAEFNITAKYGGSYKYLPSEKNITITSSKADNIIEVSVSQDKAYPEEVTITVTSLVSGDYTIDINGTEVTVSIADGETQGSAAHKFGAGSFYANITSAPTSEYYNQITQNDTFSVSKGLNNAQILISAENYLPGSVTVQVTGIKGTYVVRFNNGQNVNVTVAVDGETGENTTMLLAGDYEATLTLDNSNYTTTADMVEFSVIKSPNVVIVTVEDIYLPGIVTVKVKANATGIYNVKFNDTANSELTFEITAPNGEATQTIVLPAGLYSVNATATDTENYTSTIINDTFEVKKSDIDLIIFVDQIVYGNNVTGYIKANVSGTYTVKIADADPFTLECDSENQTAFNKDIPLTVADAYLAKISVDEQDDYNANSKDFYFDVVQTPTDFNATSTKEEYIYGEEVILNIELPDDAAGKVSFKYSNGTYIGEIADVTQSKEFSLGIIDANSNYNIYANYSGDNNYKGLQKIISFKVNKADNYIDVFVIAGDYPDNVTIMVNATVAGIYKVDINGDIYDVEANTTGISHKFDADSYYANITYSDKNYNGITTNTTFTVNKGINEIKVEVTSATYPNDVVVKVISTVEGTYNVIINNETHAIVANGDGIRLKLAAGKYSANLTDYEIANYIANTANATFTVKKAVSIIIVSVEDTILPGNVTIKVESNLAGIYNVKINDTSVDVLVEDGEGTASVYLPAGNAYYANTIFDDYENYTVKITNVPSFDVVKGDNNIVVEVESVEYPNAITVKLTADVAGTYKVDLNGTIIEIEANSTSEPIELAAGEYYANVTGYESDVYNGIITNATFAVTKKVNNINVIVENTVLPDLVVVNVTADVDGVYIIDINGTAIEVNVTSGFGSNKTKLSAGKAYMANTTFSHQNYTANITNAIFDVNKVDNNIKVEVIGSQYPDKITARVIADVDGIYNVDINGTIYNFTANAPWTPIKLGVGSYYANVTGYESDIYEAIIVNSEFTVDKSDNAIQVIVEGAVLPDLVVVNVTADVDGVYAVDINGTAISVVVTYGKGSNTTSLPAGIGYHAIVVGYDDENYTVTATNATFDVVKANNNIVVEVLSVVYPDAVIVKVTADVEGVYAVDVNGTVVNVEANGAGEAIELAAGEYYANVTGYVSDIYNGIITNVTFTVNKKTNNVVITVEDTVLPNMVTVNVTADVDGVYVVDVNGTAVEVSVNDGFGTNFTILSAGKSYMATTSFDDLENYTVNITEATFDVVKANNNIVVEVLSVVYPDAVIVKVTADVEGVYAVDVNGTAVEVEANGTSDPIRLGAGSYYANVTGYVSDIYNGIITNATFTVNKKTNNVVITVEDTVLPNMVTVNVTADVDGVYVVDVNGTAVEVSVNDGFGTNFTILSAGKSYVATTSFDDLENYTVNITEATFDINKAINNVKVYSEDYIYNGIVTINVTADVDGKYSIRLNDTTITVNVENGFGSNITELDEGSYTTSTEFADDNYELNVIEATFKVLPKEIADSLTIRDEAFIGNATIKVSGEGNVIIAIEYYLIKPDADITIESLHLNVSGEIISISDNIITESYVKAEFNIDKTSVVSVYAIYSAFDLDDNPYELISNTLTYDVEVTNSTVSISIDETAYPNNVTVLIKAGTDGMYVITVDNKTYEVNVTDGQANAILDVLPAGEYDATIVSKADESIKNTISFNVVKADDIELDITVKDGVMNITGVKDNTGNLTVTINGTSYAATLVNGSVSVDLDLYPGDYNATVTYSGDENYGEITKNVTINVPKLDVSVEDEINVTIPEGTTAPEISIDLPSDASGNLTVVINGNQTYTEPVVNGNATIAMPELPVGEYNMTVTYSGDGKYSPSTQNTTLSIPKAEIPQNSTSIKINFNKGTTQPIFGISLPEDANGNLTICIDGGESITVSVVNGVVNITGTDLEVGEHTVTVTYSGDEKYSAITQNSTFSVPKADIEDGNIHININSPVGTRSPTLTLSLPSDATGYVLVNVDGVDLHVTIENGSASVNLGTLAYGNHSIGVSYSGDGKYNSLSKNVTANIPQLQLSGSDSSILYGEVVFYAVRLTADGIPVVGKNVEFTFNGNVYNILTGNDGYAILQIPTGNILIDDYTVTAKYDDASITNNIKVNHIIVAKNLKIKKYKVLKIKVSLKKVNGKYLKGKKLKLRFNGKTYNAKTNKKGVATFKIKKSAVNKLLAGKKYLYKVTYGKDVVSKKIKVKR